MAVIRCSLKKDGRLKVLEVLEFQRGDTIELNKSAGAEKTLNPILVAIIPCPGGGGGLSANDCFITLKSFDPNKVVVKKPE